MKRLFSIVLMSFVALHALAITFSAVTTTGQTLNYNSTSRTTAEVQKTSGLSGKLIIPAQVTRSIWDLDVTSIGDYSFAECQELIRVTLPASLTSIGAYAFLACSHLDSVVIPSKVTSIGNSAFHLCSSLTHVTLPASLTSIGDMVFMDCPSLTHVTLPASLTSIGDMVFMNCHSLTHVTLPASLTSIGSKTFYGCYQLDSVVIPSKVTSIGNSAFENCSNLTRVTLPDSLTSIGSYAFKGCNQLDSVVIPSKVTSIGNSAFWGCSSLSSIEVDRANQNYQVIDGVLYNKAGNELIFCPVGKKGSVIVPDSVTKIDDDAFSGCSQLDSVVIPSKVTSIGNSAFENCSNLTRVTLPDSLTSIGSYAFKGCNQLDSVVIPSKVTSIGDGAFGDCSSLTRLFCYAQTPPSLGSGVFLSVSTSIPITVCQSAVDVYKSANGWKDFSNYTTVGTPTITLAAVNKATCDNAALELPVVIIDYHTVVNIARVWKYAYDGGSNVAFNPDTFKLSQFGGKTLTVKCEARNVCGSTLSANGISLTVNHTIRKDTTASECGSFKWRGVTYTKSCTVSDTATAANGCDSIVTLHLTVTSSAPVCAALALASAETGQPLDVSQYATATGWQKRDPYNNWKSLNVADAVTCDMSIDSVRYYSTNACGTSYSNAVKLAVHGTPTVDIYGTSLTLCANTHVSLPYLFIDTCGSSLTDTTWTISNDGFATEKEIQPYEALPYAYNGYQLRANVTNSNGEVGHSKSIPLIINDVPSFSVVPAPEWACDGAAFALSAPTISENGSELASYTAGSMTFYKKGWQIQEDSSWYSVSVTPDVIYSNNNKKIRYYATNGCGTGYSNEVTLKVYPPLVSKGLADAKVVCVGSTADSVEVTIHPDSKVASISWTLDGAAQTATGAACPISTASTAGTHNYAIAMTDQQGCTYSHTIAVTAGEGGSTCPLTIDNVADLVALREGVNSNAAFTYHGAHVPAKAEGAYFKQTADLNLATVCSAKSGTSWTPFRNFMGYLDGQQHTIDSLYMTGVYSSALFGTMTAAEVKNLNLTNIDVKGSDHLAGICAKATQGSRIVYCTTSGTLSGTQYVGGICAFITGSGSLITGCTNLADVTVGSEGAGGIAAEVDDLPQITNCVNAGNVHNNQTIDIGGIVGFIRSFTNVKGRSAVVNCLNVGNVTGQNNLDQGNTFGAIYGMLSESNIINCYYDQQMCTQAQMGPTNVNTVIGNRTGSLTTSLLGNSLKGIFPDSAWVFTDGLYPRIKQTQNLNASLVAATPAKLKVTGKTNYETVDRLLTDFTIGTGNGVDWHTNQTDIAINGEKVLLNCVYDKTDTLTVSKDNEARHIVLKVMKEQPVIVEEDFSICANADTTLSLETPMAGVWTSSHPEVATIDSYNKMSLLTAGITTLTYTSTYGSCSDSVKVTVIPVYKKKDTVRICESELPYHYGDSIFAVGSHTADHEVIFKSQLGCDSIVNLHLTVNKSEHNAMSQTVCDSVIWHGKLHTQSGTYTFDTLTANGCERVDTLKLTVNKSEHNAMSQTVCDSVRWHGKLYTQSDTYTFDTLTANGCVRVDTLHLTVNKSEHNAMSQTVCDSVIWHGKLHTQSGTYTFDTLTANGCERVDTLKLTVNKSEHNTMSQTVCDSVLWHGNLYTKSDTYTFDTLTANGCERVDTLKLTVNKSVHLDTAATVCDSFSWHNKTYFATGDYAYTVSAANGCDSTTTLHLTVNKSYLRDTFATACDSFTWRGKAYTLSGDYHYTGTTAAGCDSIIALHLTVNRSVRVDTVATACDHFTWYGKTYTVSGNYYHNGTLSTGCDSVVALKLTVNKSVHLDTAATVCDSFSWHSKTYFTTGDYDYTVPAANGCDSTTTLHLTVNKSYLRDTFATACDSFTWRGKAYTLSGDYNYTGTTTAGCDSIIALHLTVNKSVRVDTVATACDHFTWYGKTYTVSGNYYHNGTLSTGCDSIVALHLTVNKSVHHDTTATVCDSYAWYNKTYYATGDYDYTVPAANGCDSTTTLHLTVNKSYLRDTFATACDSFTWRGKAYTLSGDYNYTGTTTAGCDSIIALHLTVNKSVRVDTVATACDHFTWYGKTYTVSGDYYHNGTLSTGCDSIVALHLTVNKSVHHDTTATVCDSYAWHNKTYYATGDYDYTVPAANGCDSTTTLHLTVNKSYLRDTFATACDSFTWRGKAYTLSGDYNYTGTTTAGCDSIIALHLTVNKSVRVDTVATACDHFTWYGKTYTVSGDYYHNGTLSTGCDSIVALHLTVNKSVHLDTAATVCDSYAWHDKTYYATGDYDYTVPAANSCDSTTTLHLTVNKSYLRDTFATACDSFTWRGKAYTLSGDYNYTGTTSAGCDSIIALHLTVNKSVRVDTVATACDHFTWYGKTYTVSGNYYHNGTLSTGCDSIVVLHLTVNKSVHLDTTATVCDSYAWHDKTYYATGDYDYTVPAANGCDSTTTLHLTVNKSVHRDSVITACDHFTWLGKTYTANDTVLYRATTAAGCDSIVTLHIVIGHPSVTALSDSVYVGEGYSRNGFAIAASQLPTIGSYQFTRTETSYAGCDSIINVSLVVWQEAPISIVEAHTIAANYCAGDEAQITYSLSSGKPNGYKLTFDDAALAQGFADAEQPLGADSMVHFALLADAAAGHYTAELQLTSDHKVSQIIKIRFSVNFSSDYLDKMWSDVVSCGNEDKLFSSFQWYHDDTLIAGANKQFYCDLNGLSGTYSVRVTTPSGDSLFVCGKYFEKQAQAFSIVAMPNPATSNQKFDLKVSGLDEGQLQRAKLYIYAENGILVYSTSHVDKTNGVSLPTGNYAAIVIVDNDKSANCKILVRP
jgi:hypothetical protein